MLHTSDNLFLSELQSTETSECSEQKVSVVHEKVDVTISSSWSCSREKKVTSNQLGQLILRESLYWLNWSWIARLLSREHDVWSSQVFLCLVSSVHLIKSPILINMRVISVVWKWRRSKKVCQGSNLMPSWKICNMSGALAVQRNCNNQAIWWAVTQNIFNRSFLFPLKALNYLSDGFLQYHLWNRNAGKMWSGFCKGKARPAQWNTYKGRPRECTMKVVVPMRPEQFDWFERGLQ